MGRSRKWPFNPCIPSYYVPDPHKQTDVDKKGKVNLSLLSVQKPQALALQNHLRAEGNSFPLPLSASCLLSLLEAIIPTAGSVEEIASFASARYRLNYFILQGLQKQIQLRKWVFHWRGWESLKMSSLGSSAKGLVSSRNVILKNCLRLKAWA